MLACWIDSRFARDPARRLEFSVPDLQPAFFLKCVIASIPITLKIDETKHSRGLHTTLFRSSTLMLFRSLVLFFLTAPVMADPVRQVRPDDATGTSAAIVVDGAANLAHTEQILPIDAGGKVIAP